MLSRLVRKPRPTSDMEHCMQMKHSLCHWRSSKEMYLAPARPAHRKHVKLVNGLYSSSPFPRLVDDEHCRLPLKVLYNFSIHTHIHSVHLCAALSLPHSGFTILPHSGRGMPGTGIKPLTLRFMGDLLHLLSPGRPYVHAFT